MLKRECFLPLVFPLMVFLTFQTSIPLCGAENPQVWPSLPEAPRPVPLFDFHSNFWVNLHQVLFHEAKLRAGKPDRTVQSAPPLFAAGMSKQDEADWNAAVSFYAAYFGARQQHGDDQLVDINDNLAEQPNNGARLNPAGLPPELVGVLQSAAVAYRRYWWPAQNESNEKWIASQRERAEDLGPKLASAMSKDLHQRWPAAPIRVDVCYYVVSLGYANTTLPPHITYSGSDLTHEGLTGFELLFHEASHTFADTMTDTLSAQCRAQHKNCEDLWHAVLFYTSGVELRRLLPPSEQAGFTSYAYKYGLYTRGRWAKYRPVLESDWQAYLDGKMSFDSALRAMATHLP
jgi:hypothetical protein